MGAAAALASSALWALSSVLLTSQATRMSPLVMSAVRSTTASVCLFAALFATGGVGDVREASLLVAFSMAGSGILGQALGDTLYINALGFLGVTRSFPITNSAYPFLTFILAVALLGEDVTWTLPIGGALISIGITSIVLERQPETASGVPVELARGGLFAVAAALAWSLATVWLRGQQGDLGAISAASLRIPAASLAVMLTIAATGGARQPLRGVSGRSLLVVMAAGALGTGLGSGLFIFAVEDLGAARTAFLTTSAPLFALPMGMIFLSERVTPRVLVGTLATIGGIWLVLL